MTRETQIKPIQLDQIEVVVPAGPGQLGRTQTDKASPERIESSEKRNVCE